MVYLKRTQNNTVCNAKEDERIQLDEEEKMALELMKKKGMMSIRDIDRDEDLGQVVSDLWNLEKHLSTTLEKISEELEKNPNDEINKILFNFISNVLVEVRKHRAKHLKRLEKLKMHGIWCSYKHIYGIREQFWEVGAKDLHIACHTDDEKTKEEMLKWAMEDFKTAAFFGELIHLMKAVAEKIEKLKGGEKGGRKA